MVAHGENVEQVVSVVRCKYCGHHQNGGYTTFDLVRGGHYFECYKCKKENDERGPIVNVTESKKDESGFPI